jgi:hypothetical protein
MTFELPLTEERVKPHQVTALHLFIVLAMIITASVIMVSYYAVSHLPEDKALNYRTVLYYGLAVAMGIYAVSAIMLTRIAELIIMLVFAGYAWSTGTTVPAIIFTLLAAAIVFAINWERKKDTPLIIVVDKEGIKPPVNSRRRFIDWKEVEHVLFRFGTLTINCADNRLYQWNIGNTAFEPEVFEVFCIRQVDKAREKRDKNDW